jgi:hydroxypyruvate reductase
VAAFLDAYSISTPLYLLAIGKAAAPMAAGAFDALGEGIASALVITKQGYWEPLFPLGSPVVHREAAHPVPDATSLAAGQMLLDYLAEVPAEAELLVLLSGGASSLVEHLPPGVAAEDLQKINGWLLGSGLPIEAVNRVRKRLSCLKGGRLAAYLRGQKVLNLLLSDVPGDDPQLIGSGLLVAHRPEDMAVEGLALPTWLQSLLARSPPLPEESAWRRIHTQVIARPREAWEAARRAALAAGLAVHGKQRLVAGDAVARGRQLARRVLAGPAGVTLWGGETTVCLPPRPGRGGRCQSLALAAAVEIGGHPGVSLLAAGSDGSDGPGAAAGALVDGGTLERGRQAGLEALHCLAGADAGTFLEASGDLLYTGPTGTNVMDLMFALKA